MNERELEILAKLRQATAKIESVSTEDEALAPLWETHELVSELLLSR